MSDAHRGEVDARTANLLGALALAVADRVHAATLVDAAPGANERAALVTLAHHPGQPIDALRRTLDLTHSGTVRLVDRLEEADLVTRATAGRGRALALRLAPAGEVLVARLLAERREALQAAIGALGPEERAALAPLLEKLLASLTTRRESVRRICRLCDEQACERDATCPVDAAAREADEGHEAG